MQFQRGQIVTVTTTEMVPGGAALGKLSDGRPVFVRHGAPKEVAEIRLTRIKRDFAEGEFVQAVKPSPDRVMPHFSAPSLAGADWSHLRYAAQLVSKEQIIGQLLEKIGHLPIDTFQVSGVRCPIVRASEVSRWRYRNKVELTFGVDHDGRVALGFHPSGHFDQIIPTTDVALFPEVAQPIIRAVIGWANSERLSVFDPRRKVGFLRNLVIRRAERSSDLLLNLVTCPGKIPENSLLRALRHLPLSGLVWTENAAAAMIVRADAKHVLAGSEYIEENFLGLPIRYRADSFFQTNTVMAEKLAQTLLDRLHPLGKNLIDGYAGVGVFGLLAARRGANVISIESHETSISDARANAERLGIVDQMKFIHNPMEKFLKIPDVLLAIRDAILIVDPPRAGLHPKVVKAIVASDIRRMFYVSCNPATLARDLSLLMTGPSQLTPIFLQPFDFFPQTPHVEILVELERSS